MTYIYMVHLLKPDGKPSTWLPPGEVVACMFYIYMVHLLCCVQPKNNQNEHTKNMKTTKH